MSGAKAGEVVLKAGTLKGYAADFGMLVVPENRQKKDSRLIRLPVLRMGCRRERALEPVFTLLSSTPSVKFLPEALRTLAFFRWRCLDLTARYGR
jgi:hypothetical protein